MKNQIIKIMASLVLLIGLTVLFSQCETVANDMQDVGGVVGVDDRSNGLRQSTDPCTCILEKFAYEDLNDDEIDALLFMREEEKMARDVYREMFRLYNLGIFDRISQSEQRHLDAVTCLLKKYQLIDRVANEPAGVFTNPDLQRLFKDLVARGSQNEAEALRVGATIEDLDISDLLKAIDATDNQDIAAVFNELMRGSRNHLRAFAGNLKTRNLDYSPAFIAADLYASILSSDQERGGQLCINPENDCSGKRPGKNGNCDRCGKGKKGDCPNNQTGPGNGQNGPNRNRGGGR